MKERLARSAAQAEAPYLYDVLNAAELVLKVTVGALVAAIRRDPAGHQYRLEATLVRADGVGDWVRVLDEILTGPASDYVAVSAEDGQRQLTETVVASDWRRAVLDLLDHASEPVSHERPGFRRAQLRQFFTTFTWLRNKTKGHGAPDLELSYAIATPSLRPSNC
jgi:hypothetical protein